MHVRNVIIIILVFIICFCKVCSSYAQNTDTNITNLNSILSKRFKVQSFQLNQFINRFNFEEPLNIGNFEQSRKVNLLALLNQVDTFLLRQAITTGFLDTFSTVNHKIIPEIDNWQSNVYAEFSYKGKPVEIILSLKLNGTESEGYSWEITKVQSRLFEPPSVDNNKGIFINPQNNEIMFSELSKFFQAGTNDPVSIYEQPFYYSPLSSFRDYIKNNEIIFSHIAKMQYVFINIAGYSFTVENFIRNQMNAGLLISSITKYK